MPKTRNGICSFCHASDVALTAVLIADPDQRVCRKCHRDPRVPTALTPKSKRPARSSKQKHALSGPDPTDVRSEDQIDSLKRSLRSTARKLGAAMRERDERTEALHNHIKREGELYAKIEALQSSAVVPEFDTIMSAARRWHLTEVNSIADEAIKELAAKRKKSPMTESEAREWLVEWVDQTTDGHEHVIYTGQATLLLAASSNDTAYEDESGEKPADSSAAACWALRADVWEALDHRSDEWEHDDDDEELDDDASAPGDGEGSTAKEPKS